MSSLRDRFNKLKTSIVGTKTSKIDARLDKAVQDIVSYKSNSGRNGYVDLVKNLISKGSGGDINIDNQGGIFGQGTTNPGSFGQGGRLMRYKTYQSIIDNINYCYRALDVITDNILAPDDITKVSLEISPKSYLGDEVPDSSKISMVREVLDDIKLESNLHIIARNTLLLGDFFCEIADAKTAVTSRAFLAEQVSQLEEDIRTERKEILNFSKPNLKIVMDYTAFAEGPIETSKISDTTKDNIEIQNIQLVFHEPGRVVKLQSDMFPLCFGYLIFPRTVTHPNQMMQDQAINSICVSIIKSLEKRIPQMSDYANDKELKNIIAAMVNESDESRAMNIRYVPSDRIQHFQRPSTKYYPYGESIFDSTQYTAKVLIALETALAIQRLSRSTEKRKIGIELGLPRDARKMIEKLKEEFRKRKISLDSFGTIDTIPSMVTTFEDIYIPQKDGKAFVEVDTFTGGNVDMRTKVDELKFLRDQCVSSLGVPASFLNIEENLSNKSALTEENILFARTIISHQKYLTEQINDLLQKVFNIINPEEALSIFDHITVALPPPKSLQFEREAKYISDLTNLVESLERIGVPKDWAKKKYLTSIDWDEVDNYDIDEQIDKKLGTKKEEDDNAMSGMGGMGGSF